MNCPNCGSTIHEGSVFCTNCGTPITSVAPETVEQAPAAAESAFDQPAQAPVAPVQPAAPDFAAAPAAPEAAPYAAPAAPDFAAAPAAPEAAAPYVAPEGTPYAGPQSYEQPGQQAVPGYAAPAAGYQPQPQAAPKVYAPTTGISRALAMSTYWGLLPLIFCWVVADKDGDPFIRHHLNQAIVILIGGLIAGVLSVIFIGVILAIYLLVMGIMGTVQAYHSEMTELPLIGKIKILK